MNECLNCVFARRDWTNPENTSIYCGNRYDDNFGSNILDIKRCARDNYEVKECITCARASDHCGEPTRCPIEEHYALPIDGFCHLWEAVKK